MTAAHISFIWAAYDQMSQQVDFILDFILGKLLGVTTLDWDPGMAQRDPFFISSEWKQLCLISEDWS